MKNRNIKAAMSLMLLACITGCSGEGTDVDPYYQDPVERKTDTTIMAMAEERPYDSFNIEFIKRSDEHVVLYLHTDDGQQGGDTVRLIDANETGTYHLACGQDLYDAVELGAQYNCSGVTPSKEIAFHMTLLPTVEYRANTRYDRKPLWGGETYALEHNSSNGHLTITKL